MNEFYVYIYLDPRKPGRYCYEEVSFLFEPIYVGKGKNNRYKTHLTRAATNILKYKIENIKLKKLTPFILFYSTTSVLLFFCIFKQAAVRLCKTLKKRTSKTR